MNENPSPSDTGSMATFVEDVFVTDSFLIKGRIENKSRRLRDILETNERTFLTITDATMVSLRGTEVIRTPRVKVNVDEVLFAHELLDTAGDTELKRLSTDDKSVRIRAFYSGNANLELAGMVERGAYEATAGGGRNYFVMQQPNLRGVNVKGNKELNVLDGLTYAIVRKDRMAYVYDFS